MKRTNAETVGQIIQHYLETEKLDTKIYELRVAELWADVVGAGVNRYTVNRYVKDGCLFVRLSSATLRNELMLGRSVLVKRLNEAVGHEVIKDIIFR